MFLNNDMLIKENFMIRVLNACLISICGSTASAQLASQLITSDIDRPVFVTHAGDGSGRLFIIEQEGVVRIVNAKGELIPEPFIDIDSEVHNGDSNFTEQGLLGLAFHPDYDAAGKPGEGKFYLNFTVPGNDTRVVEYQVSDDNPSIANESTARLIVQFDQPGFNHNGGWIGFGPDGYLYIATGDGGGANDLQDRASRLSEPMGKIHRIDINGGDDFPDDENRNYIVPLDNPFLDVEGALESVWHYGLRNPWRMSFDKAIGDMWIGDVGQTAWEEVNHNIGNIAGINYGWRCREGRHSTGLVCSSTEHTDPQHEYPHESGGCSVIGGYVYRGCALGEDYQGLYFFGDYCSGNIQTLDPENSYSLRFEFDYGFSLSSLGEDEHGELYAMDTNSGKVVKIINPSAADNNSNGIPDACESSQCKADLTGDGELDFFDVSAFLDAFGTENPLADFTNDGEYDFFDVSAFLDQFGKECRK